jgi:hypothetical protein
MLHHIVDENVVSPLHALPQLNPSGKKWMPNFYLTRCIGS